MRRRRRDPVPWEHDWRNPDMQVLRSWMEERGFGLFIKRSEFVDAADSTALSQDSLNYSDAPEWRTDPTYNLKPRRRKRPRQRL